MRVKCVMCDGINRIDNDSPEAKKLRNRLIHTYMCPKCNERIKIKTLERHKTGRFKLYKQEIIEDEFLS
ncbi:YlaI family protein [Gracilibacillus xinjiangensis]|uniref:YlaI family protein n=1 Tax=Gracilibacillus xinjiangensis TaxID=1193282 RepID=A0ABV8WXV1_9BACI